MKNLFPDLYSDLVPGMSAAGFSLGESFFNISEKIGVAEWYGPEVPVRDILLQNKSWVGIKRKIGFGDELLFSYRFMNEVVSLYFENSGRLYRIAVGEGYRGKFSSVGVGDDLRSLERGFDVLFNDADDDFLLRKDGKILSGVSFVTDYRASLEDAPEQVIKFISIHDWSLR
ncbi:hypothetical protein B1F73_26315 [Pseudomonas syringae]|uniref:Uncharacterized protein n=1 Tax=Pseudomonas syringae TaxID=317 RepID=A0AB37ZIH6_PSESX|nr:MULTISPECIES: hypothetical protein [Pseudomonas]MBI6669907.1 hypothetical protein [Pseudomonas syringae]MBI6677423.1 hypothetical protein [Pseudomonas syringae]MBI6836853.1 hypothetical protein [Pseudomonas syringae]NAP03481.1 hypothetical protein [Pseudomonas syringae]NAP20238.1 hypothetical protein [Pseudomonas syringae]